jgi:hypothetical protein
VWLGSLMHLCSAGGQLRVVSSKMGQLYSPPHVPFPVRSHMFSCWWQGTKRTKGNEHVLFKFLLVSGLLAHFPSLELK